MISIDKTKGHLAVITANIFFGLNVPATKDLMSNWLTPSGYIISRVGLATLLFWLIGFFMPAEKVPRKDIALLGLGGLFGVIGAQYLVAVSLEYTSPVYFSLMSAMSPAIVMFFAAIFLREPITRRKASGVLVGISGAVILVANSFQSGVSGNLQGILIALMSVTSYALYLIIIRLVATKYSPLTQMKWTYLSASVFLVPIMAVSSLFADNAMTIEEPANLTHYCELGFIVIFATVISFMLVPYGLKYLRPTTVSIYINLQPVVASVVAIILGQDIFTWEKPIAGVLVLLGAYIVTTSPAKARMTKSTTSI